MHYGRVPLVGVDFLRSVLVATRGGDGRVVKRAITVIVSTVSLVVLPALSALAQRYPPDAPPGGGGVGDAGPDALPFTGASISVGFVILILLVAAGVALLILGRRRRKAATA
jgi:LPXTG-motif cell wall-anchored protein